jgi:hypothetical protein
MRFYDEIFTDGYNGYIADFYLRTDGYSIPFKKIVEFYCYDTDIDYEIVICTNNKIYRLEYEELLHRDRVFNTLYSKISKWVKE